MIFSLGFLRSSGQGCSKNKNSNFLRFCTYVKKTTIGTAFRGHSEQGGSPFFLGHSGFVEQKVLHRSEKGEAKKKSSTFSSLLSLKKLCRCFVDSMQRWATPHQVGPSWGHCYSDHVSPLCCFTTIHFDCPQHCSFHFTRNQVLLWLLSGWVKN